jgi:hypothetical protein
MTRRSAQTGSTVHDRSTSDARAQWREAPFEDEDEDEEEIEESQRDSHGVVSRDGWDKGPN